MSQMRLFTVALMVMLVLMLACSGQQAETESTEAVATESTEAAATEGAEGEVFEGDFEEGGTAQWQDAGDQAVTDTVAADENSGEAAGEEEAPAPE